jgi:hypothetical protein
MQSLLKKKKAAEHACLGNNHYTYDYGTGCSRKETGAGHEQAGHAPDDPDVRAISQCCRWQRSCDGDELNEWWKHGTGTCR